VIEGKGFSLHQFKLFCNNTVMSDFRMGVEGNVSCIKRHVGDDKIPYPLIEMVQNQLLAPPVESVVNHKKIAARLCRLGDRLMAGIDGQADPVDVSTVFNLETVCRIIYEGADFQVGVKIVRDDVAFHYFLLKVNPVK